MGFRLFWKRCMEIAIEHPLLFLFIYISYTSPKTNMDTQNDGLEKVDSFKIWPFLVSILDFWGVTTGQTIATKSPKTYPKYWFSKGILPQKLPLNFEV